jgi:hypothetical protein
LKWMAGRADGPRVLHVCGPPDRRDGVHRNLGQPAFYLAPLRWIR